MNATQTITMEMRADRAKKRYAALLEERKLLKAELAICLQTIKDKVKGEIRKAQKRKKELLDMIDTNLCLSGTLHNGGIY